MNHKSIEQQIAELTPEQKSNMGKIFKREIISIAAVLIGFIVIAGSIFAYASIKEKQAKVEYDTIQAQIEFNTTIHYHDLTFYDKSEELFDEYYDMKQLKTDSLMVGSGVSLAAVLVICAIFKVKYPYFSEKKYKYLKKTENTTCPKCGA